MLMLNQQWNSNVCSDAHKLATTHAVRELTKQQKQCQERIRNGHEEVDDDNNRKQKQ